MQTDIESPHAIHNASKCFFIPSYKAALYCLPARQIMFIKFQLFLQQSRWSMLNELKVDVLDSSHHGSFGGGLFDFDPEDYYQPPPTRPPRPARPTQPPFMKPPRPDYHDEDRFDRPGHTTVIHRPKPTTYPWRPPATKPPRPNRPSSSLHGSHHNHRPQVSQDPPNKVDFYPDRPEFYPDNHYPYPENNEVDSSLNTASKFTFSHNDIDCFGKIIYFC